MSESTKVCCVASENSFIHLSRSTVNCLIDWGDSVAMPEPPFGSFHVRKGLTYPQAAKIAPSLNVQSKTLLLLASSICPRAAPSDSTPPSC